jgi:excisionase family DNA binding protein
MSAKVKQGLGLRRRDARPSSDARHPSEAGSYNPAVPAPSGTQGGSNPGHPSAAGSYDPAAPALSAEGARAPAPAAADDVLDVADAMRLLRIGRNTLYELVNRNEIPHRRLGKQIRFSRAAIMRWFDSWSSQDAKERQ